MINETDIEGTVREMGQTMDVWTETPAGSPMCYARDAARLIAEARRERDLAIAVRTSAEKTAEDYRRARAEARKELRELQEMPDPNIALIGRLTAERDAALADAKLRGRQGGEALKALHDALARVRELEAGFYGKALAKATDRIAELEAQVLLQNREALYESEPVQVELRVGQVWERRGGPLRITAISPDGGILYDRTQENACGIIPPGAFFKTSAVLISDVEAGPPLPR